MMLITDPTSRASIPDILSHKWMRRTVGLGFGLGLGLGGLGAGVSMDSGNSAMSYFTPVSFTPTAIAPGRPDKISRNSEEKEMEKSVHIHTDKIDIMLKNGNLANKQSFRPTALERENVPSLRLTSTDKKDRTNTSLRSSSLNKDDSNSIRLSSRDKGERPSFRSSSTIKPEYSSDSAFSTLSGATISVGAGCKLTARSHSNSTIKLLNASPTDYNLGSYFTADGEPINRVVSCVDVMPNTESTSSMSSTLQIAHQNGAKTHRGCAPSPGSTDVATSPSWHSESAVISHLTTPCFTPRLPSEISQAQGESRRCSHVQGLGLGQGHGHMLSQSIGNVLSESMSNTLNHSLRNILDERTTGDLSMSQSAVFSPILGIDLGQNTNTASACSSVSVPASLSVSVTEDVVTTTNTRSPTSIEIRRSTDSPLAVVLTLTAVSTEPG